MAESLFDIFGDHLTRQTAQTGKNVLRQPGQYPIKKGNVAKPVSTGPVKPNEPVKKGEETKKSFLCNTGKALQTAPMQPMLTPKNRNLLSTKLLSPRAIYSDADADAENNEHFYELEFSKPSYKYNNFHTDVLDYYLLPEPEYQEEQCPPTPPPCSQTKTMEMDSSYEDDFFSDNFSTEELAFDDDLQLPALY